MTELQSVTIFARQTQCNSCRVTELQSLQDRHMSIMQTQLREHSLLYGELLVKEVNCCYQKTRLHQVESQDKRLERVIK